jgi:hypothetical protein
MGSIAGSTEIDREMVSRLRGLVEVSLVREIKKIKKIKDRRTFPQFR